MVKPSEAEGRRRCAEGFLLENIPFSDMDEPAKHESPDGGQQNAPICSRQDHFLREAGMDRDLHV